MKKLQNGRSMIEMLGVLAIIGVLSVGAIAGYQKAMMKYKLNKQAQQLSQLLNVAYRHKASWGINPPYMDLIPYFKKLGEIPKEMIKDETNNLYDVFQNEISISTNGCDSSCLYVNVGYKIHGNKNFDICKNIFTVAKEFHADLWSVMAYAKANEDASEYKDNGYRYGDKYCSQSENCLKDLTLDDIHNECEYCAKSYNCSFNLQYKIAD